MLLLQVPIVCHSASTVNNWNTGFN